MTATLASLGFDIKTAPIKGATKDLGRMETASKSVSKSLSAMTAVFGLAAVAAGGLSFSRLISESTNFDTSMRKLQATSRATRDEMKALEEQARTLGATTMFSAKETADAQQFLAMAGFSVNKIISATPAVLKLATAASMDLGSAADIASNVLGGMGYQVEELDRVLDTLAATASGSNTSIQQLGQALSFAAPVAVSAGLSIEQTAAAIGVLSDSGLQGSRAGTGLVGVIRSLSRVTPIAQTALASYGLSVEDVNIKTHGLSVVLDRLKDANIETGDTFKIFGSEAGTAANLLAKGAGSVSEFTSELNQASGAAEDMADIIGGGLSGTWASFSSAISESVLQMGRSGGVAGALEAVTKEATGIISVYNGMTKEFAAVNDLSEEQVTNLENTAAAWKAVGFAVGGMAAVYLATSTATGVATVAQLAFNAAAMVNPYVFIAASIAAAAAAVYSFTSAQETALSTWEKAKESEAAYNAASSSITAQNQLTKIVNDRIKAQEKLNALEEKGYKKYGSDGNKAIALRKEINELTEKYHTITNARIEATKAQNDRLAAQEAEKIKALEQQAAMQKQMQEAQDQAAARELQMMTELNTQRLNSIYGRVDPIKAEIIAYTELSATIQEVVKDEKEAARLQNLAAQQYVKNIKRINEAASESVKKSAADQHLQDIGKGMQEYAAGINTLAGAMQGMYSSGERGYKNLAVAMQAANVVSAAGAVLNQANGDPYTAFGRMAAMAAAVAGLGYSVGSLGGGSDTTAADRQAVQGTGTVLGYADEKSESILKATDITAKATSELVGINRGMLRALEAMQSGIEGASTRIVMAGTPDFNIQTVHNLTDKNFGAKLVGESYDAIGSIVTLGLYNNLGKDLGNLLGGKTKLTDSGLDIGGGAIGGLGGDIAAYQGSKTRKHRLDDYDDNADVTAQIDADAKRQFGLVYESIIDTIAESGKIFGITEKEIRKVNVAAQKLSLKGLSAEQQQKELEAYFGKVFDTTTKAVFDWLNDPKLAKAGEGLGETMVRVATNIQVAEEAAKQLGFTMGGAVKEELALASQTLIEAVGGIDQFTSSMKSFISSFATEAQQFEINQGALNRALADAKLPLADSRAGYWALMQAQDASTEKGAQNIATLLRLQGAADSYYSTLEKKAAEHAAKVQGYASDLARAREEDARDAISKQQAIAGAQLSAQNSVLQAAVSNASAVNQALGGLNTQDTASSRESALASIREMTRTGNIGDDLQSTLASATAINAADFATFNDYVRTVARTGEALGGLKGVTDAKVTREQELLAGIERRIEAMAEELANIGKSNAKHTSKTAAILERIELDGIDIREVENA